jgi:predicted nuclease of predicted toxin-antitoxin system
VRDYGMQAATDGDILARAAGESRIVVSADADFGTLLAVREEAHASDEQGAIA